MGDAQDRISGDSGFRGTVYPFFVRSCFQDVSALPKNRHFERVIAESPATRAKCERSTIAPDHDQGAISDSLGKYVRYRPASRVISA